MRICKSLFTATLTVLFAACSGGNSPEALAKETMDTMEHMVVTLESVKDEASAKAAAAKLQGDVTHMNELKPKMEAMNKADPKVAAEQKAKMEQRMGGLMQRMMKESMRIGTDPKLSAALDLEKIMKQMKD